MMQRKQLRYSIGQSSSKFLFSLSSQKPQVVEAMGASCLQLSSTSYSKPGKSIPLTKNVNASIMSGVQGIQPTLLRNIDVDHHYQSTPKPSKFPSLTVKDNFRGDVIDLPPQLCLICSHGCKDADASARKEAAARKRVEDIAAGVVQMNGCELFEREPWVFDDTSY